MSNADNRVGPVCVTVCMPNSMQRGRVFLPIELLRTVDQEDLKSHFQRLFVEEDDKVRLELLDRAISRPYIVVETYPGETSPVELHSYVRCPEVSADAIFACVLVNYPALQRLLEAPPHIVAETASFQVIESDYSPASVTAGLENWLRRVWPNANPPEIEIREWPTIEVSRYFAEEGLRHQLRPQSRIRVIGASASIANNDYLSREPIRIQ